MERFIDALEELIEAGVSDIVMQTFIQENTARAMTANLLTAVVLGCLFCLLAICAVFGIWRGTRK